MLGEKATLRRERDDEEACQSSPSGEGKRQRGRGKAYLGADGLVGVTENFWERLEESVGLAESLNPIRADESVAQRSRVASRAGRIRGWKIAARLARDITELTRQSP